MSSVLSGPPRSTSFRIGEHVIAPGLVLSPMEGVTDLTFRRLVRQIGGVGLTVTEFVPGAAVARGDKKMMQLVEFDTDEWPVSVQLYGKDPRAMAEGAKVIQDMGATFCDINMGCPSKKVCKSSGGSALMKDVETATAIVRAVVAAVDIPVTVKMRSGFDAGRRNAPELAWACQEEGAAAVAIHWRTREDKYSGTRAVDKIAETKAKLSIPVLANGDVVDVESAAAMYRDTDCDGLLIGRGAIRDPWIFRRIEAWMTGQPQPTVDGAEKRRAMLQYVEELRARMSRTFPDTRKLDRAVLGRFKMLTKYFALRQLHEGRVLRQLVLHSQELPVAIEHVEAYFERLVRFEAGDESAFEGYTAPAFSRTG
ncbi:MAG: tRNA-dihydrouridine synthase [Proteobacteria bacterium]|nr:tRNA-dihydrouridine synthase [Pseudomonadota bacterium]MCP4918008.1 tRNA-dihydrouridine synthase [Pseudomonadota bacterium]